MKRKWSDEFKLTLKQNVVSLDDLGVREAATSSRRFEKLNDCRAAVDTIRQAADELSQEYPAVLATRRHNSTGLIQELLTHAGRPLNKVWCVEAGGVVVGALHLVSGARHVYAETLLVRKDFRRRLAVEDAKREVQIEGELFTIGIAHSLMWQAMQTTNTVIRTQSEVNAEFVLLSLGFHRTDDAPLYPTWEFDGGSV